VQERLSGILLVVRVDVALVFLIVLGHGGEAI
jgi:hypothetical protein